MPLTGGEAEGEWEGVGGTGVEVKVPGWAVEDTVEEGGGEPVAAEEGVSGAVAVATTVPVPAPC